MTLIFPFVRPDHPRDHEKSNSECNGYNCADDQRNGSLKPGQPKEMYANEYADAPEQLFNEVNRYPYTAQKVRPRTMCRCISQAAISVGRMAMPMNAAIGPHWISTDPQKVDNPTDAVRAIRRVNRNA